MYKRQLQMSKRLGKELDDFLEMKETTLSDLNNKGELLTEAQDILYTETNTTIRMGRSSGAFAVLDATVNTEIANAAHSRSGVYLRLINVSSNVVLSPETILFRGSPEIARAYGLEPVSYTHLVSCVIQRCQRFLKTDMTERYEV